MLQDVCLSRSWTDDHLAQFSQRMLWFSLLPKGLWQEIQTFKTGDTDDKNPFKNLDVTSAAGSDLSAVRQTGYFIKIFICYAQRAKSVNWNCLVELLAGSTDALVDKEVEKESWHILWMTGRVWHQYGIKPYYDSKDCMTK